MKILHVSTPSTWRGGEQQVAYLVLALEEEQIDQVVLTPHGSSLSQKISTAEARVIGFHKRGLLDLSLAAKIAKLCTAEKFDLIHAHDSHAHSAAVLSNTIFGSDTAMIVSRRVDFPVSGNLFSRWKYNHPLIRRIICVSEMIRQITAPSINDPSKLTVVYSGIDIDKYHPPTSNRKLIRELGLSDNVKLIGNLSALADHKDYPTFLRTAAILYRQDPSLHFIIAGKGPEEENIKNKIEELHLLECVHMLGFREDVSDVMQSLDVFLITSVTEGLGTIILEAFAAGVPVVATRAGGIPEMVEDGITGLLTNPGDAAYLANAVTRILKDPPFRQALIDNAYNKVQSFTFRSTAKNTLDIYREVIREAVK